MLLNRGHANNFSEWNVTMSCQSTFPCFYFAIGLEIIYTPFALVSKEHANIPHVPDHIIWVLQDNRTIT